jgi:hypothetical protein
MICGVHSNPGMEGVFLAGGSATANPFPQKKAARTVFCSCREASDATYFQQGRRQSLPPHQLEYIHHSIDSTESKYRNRNYFHRLGDSEGGTLPSNAKHFRAERKWTSQILNK